MARNAASLLRDRRGDTQATYFILGEFVLIAIIIIVFLQFVREIRENTILEKNYLARDLALLTDTVYAAPGAVDYLYGDGASPFIVQWQENMVKVHEPQDRVPKQYWFADSGFGSVRTRLTSPSEIEFVAVNGQVMVR